MQMHVICDLLPSKDDIVAAMRSYGLPVYVTEFDALTSNCPGTRDQVFAEQAQIYGDMLSAAMASGVCSHFPMLNLSDKYSPWTQVGTADYMPNAYPAAWDDQLQPKPAYYAMLDVLKNPPSVTP